MAVFDTLQIERAKYGTPMTNEQCVEMLNTVAWIHRAEGWGLSGKTSGTRARRYDGVEVAHDILHHLPTNDLYDVLEAAPTVARPIFNNVGKPFPGRPFIAPIEPKSGSSHPVPTPTPSPGPTVPPPNVVEQRLLDAITAAKQAILANDDADHNELATRINILVDTLAPLSGTLTQLAERVEVAIRLAERATIASENSPTYHGSTRAFGGSLTLTPKRT